MINFQNQKVGVLGLGEENTAVILYLKNKGAKITICDQRGEREALKPYLDKLNNVSYKLRLGSSYLDNLTDFDIVFRTPGLPYLNPKLQEAKKNGVEVSSQTKLFFSLCPSPIIGVTGTKGKGTTASLIYEILNQKSEIRNQKIFLGGNIGNAPIEFLEKLTPEDVVVLELSSFQLQDLDKSPHIAVVLDIKIDHLDYHQDEKEYVEAKLNIVKHQTKKDFAVICADYLTSFEFAAQTPAKVLWFSRRKSIDEGVWIKQEKEIILRTEEGDYPIVQTDELVLRGKHNWENVCAGVCASHLAGADVSSVQKAAKAFRGLEHRLEFVREKDGVSYFNDSFSTTPDTTIAALKSFREPVVLLLGGSEKNADYSGLAQEISQSSVKTIINIGQTGKKIINLIQGKKFKIIADIQPMAQAVKNAQGLTQKGDIVLLSPASASFDRYKNYKERGKVFKKEVLNL